MQRHFLENILKYGILVLSVSSVGQWLRIPIGPTVLWWAFYILMIWVFIRLRDKSSYPFLYVLWITCIAVSSIYGTTFCRDYWDWKMLVGNGLSYAICTSAIMAFSPELMQKTLGFLYKHIWKIFLLLVWFLKSDGISKYMLPFTFLAIFYSLLNTKTRKYVWAALLITLIFGYECRTDILKFLFCIASGLFFVRHEFTRYIRRWYWVLFVLPILLFVLAANGTFNVFNIGEIVGVSEDDTGRISTADTRTLLYEEVISTSQERGTIWQGNTPARGYYSEWFIVVGDDSDTMGDAHYGERGGTESSVLNVFLHFGLIGLLIYMTLFWCASYLGIFKAKNIYMSIIGLYVAFRFMIGWVEDFTYFDLNMFFLWAMIGMCYSPYFRDMSDDEFREWFENIVR